MSVDSDLISADCLATRKRKRGKRVHGDVDIARNIGDTNAVVLPSSKKKAVPAPAPTAPAVSKREARRIAKIADAKAAAALQRSLLSALESTRMSRAHHKLMLNSGTLGVKLTLKQQLQRALRQERAGIRPADDGVRLTVSQLDAEEKAALLRRTMKKKGPADANTASTVPPVNPSVTSSTVDAFGLPIGRWRSVVAAPGKILFNTERTITYDSDDDGDGEMDEDDDTDDGKAVDDDGDDDDEDDDDSAMPQRNEDVGMFTVPFDVIKASNRPKRKRVPLLLPGQVLTTIAHTDVAGESIDCSVNKSSALTSKAGALSFEGVEDDEEMADQDTGAVDDKMTSGPIYRRGVKFVRSVLAPPIRKPLAEGQTVYEANEPELNVSHNEELIGADKDSAQDAAHTKTDKGKAIAVTSKRTDDTAPRLFSRLLPKRQQSASHETSDPFAIYVNRLRSMELSRLELPILGHEADIMELINQHDVVLLAGATGSGKTTQVAQFLLENGYGGTWAHGRNDHCGLIGVTEPRRVAAVSTAHRVAAELNFPLNKTASKQWTAQSQDRPYSQCNRSALTTDEFAEVDRLTEDEVSGRLVYYNPYNVVAYQVRYDSSTVTDATRIKFMTDGVLLRECSAGALLNGYGAIIVDEAHERGLNTDVLVGLLSRIVVIRRRRYEKWIKNGRIGEALTPLKLIIMSATLDLGPFQSNSRLFSVPPPLFEIPSRQHSVTPHFNRRTPVNDYLPAALTKLVRMHAQLPGGAILVFVTGRTECDWICEKMSALHKRTAAKKIQLSGDTKRTKQNDDRPTNDEYNLSDEDEDEDEEDALKSDNASTTDRVNGKKHRDMLDHDDSYESNDGDDIRHNDEDLSAVLSRAEHSLGLRCLPLYSLLPTVLQMRVFEPPQHDERLIVVATNIAETSLTIPNVRYVLDTGREKRRDYDPVTGATTYRVGWISAASAQQRMGRAGRTGPGHCYRLYSSAVFTRFTPHSEPEILRQPLDCTILQLKAMGIDSVTTFPLPTPPNDSDVHAATRTLAMLGALTKSDDSHKITPLGRTLSIFPVLPRYAKMIVLGSQGGCLPFVIALVAALSIEEIFLHIRLSDKNEAEHDDDADDSADNHDADTSVPTGSETDRKRDLYNRLSAARRRWRHDHSDVLTALRVIGGYEWTTRSAESAPITQSGGNTRDLVSRRVADAQKAFCADNFLRLKAMADIADLRKQLSLISVNKLQLAVHNSVITTDNRAAERSVDADEEEEVNESTHIDMSLSQPPTPLQERLLRQIVLAGSIDRIARKMSDETKRAFAHKDETINLAGAYECVATNDPVFIHPSSALFPARNQPLFLSYHSLQVSGANKRFMRECTAIESEWIVRIAAEHCDYSSLLTDPSPVYDAALDRIVAFQRATFGPRRWELPIQKVAMQSRYSAEAKTDVRLSATVVRSIIDDSVYRHLARCLLNGDIYQPLHKLRPFMTHRPQHALNEAAALNATLFAVVNELQRRRTDTAQLLEAQWKKDPQWLLKEVSNWIVAAAQQQLRQLWPPCNARHD